jgi:hypothetical protein
MSLGITSLMRIFISIPAVVFASCLATASADPASTHACAGLHGPSNFDYVVLASMADSPHLLAMAGYRSTATRRGASLPRHTEN